MWSSRAANMRFRRSDSSSNPITAPFTWRERSGPTRRTRGGIGSSGSCSGGISSFSCFGRCTQKFLLSSGVTTMKMMRSTSTTSTSGVTFIAGSTTFFLPPVPRLIAMPSAPRVRSRRLVASRGCGGHPGIRSRGLWRRSVWGGGLRSRARRGRVLRGVRFLPAGVVGGGARAVLGLLAHHEVQSREADLLRPRHELADLSVLEMRVPAQHQTAIGILLVLVTQELYHAVEIVLVGIDVELAGRVDGDLDGIDVGLDVRIGIEDPGQVD